jgi:hypothetical protein
LNHQRLTTENKQESDWTKVTKAKPHDREENLSRTTCTLWESELRTPKITKHGWCILFSTSFEKARHVTLVSVGCKMCRLKVNKIWSLCIKHTCLASQDVFTRAVINHVVEAYKAYRQIASYSPCIKKFRKNVQQNDHWMATVPTL